MDKTTGNKKALYFRGLDVFSRLGVNGSGGLASMARSRSSALRSASSGGSKSSFSSSAVDAVCLAFVFILGSLGHV